MMLGCAFGSVSRKINRHRATGGTVRLASRLAAAPSFGFEPLRLGYFLRNAEPAHSSGNTLASRRQGSKFHPQFVESALTNAR
jgi:hypothetical protein